MSISIDKAQKIFDHLDEKAGLAHLIANLQLDHTVLPTWLPKDTGLQGLHDRMAAISHHGHALRHLPPRPDHPDLDKLAGSIENFIGFTQVPTGVVGPLRVNGSEAKGDFLVTLATTEGALVASYQRGTKGVGLSGGVVSICLTEGVRRSPLFGFWNMEAGIRFMIWIVEHKQQLFGVANGRTQHGSLSDILLNMEGNHVILTFEYLTGDAAGQNMVTICTDAVCHYIQEHSPVKPRYWYVESNYSGDKKASALSFTTVRGKKVSAECVISQPVLERVLKTTAASVANYWRASTVSVIQSGSIGAQGHFANGLTALFLATGQDVACVSEAAVGITRMEVVNGTDLYVSVTLPNLIVGTLGGGTKFSTQQECLQLMGCAGSGQARKFAEVCGALLLCGELSIASALAEGHFTSAHQALGRVL